MINLLSDFANFARTKGARDKGKRQSRLGMIRKAIVPGALIGTGLLAAGLGTHKLMKTNALQKATAQNWDNAIGESAELANKARAVGQETQRITRNADNLARSNAEDARSLKMLNRKTAALDAYMDSPVSGDFDIVRNKKKYSKAERRSAQKRIKSYLSEQRRLGRYSSYLNVRRFIR